MQTAAMSTKAITDSLQDVQSTSAQARLSCEHMLSSSQELSKKASEMINQVDNFLTRIRMV